MRRKEGKGARKGGKPYPSSFWLRIRNGGKVGPTSRLDPNVGRTLHAPIHLGLFISKKGALREREKG